MIPLPTLLALGLASYRGTRLIVLDSITEPVRDKVTDRYAYAEGRAATAWGFLSKLINCTYCAGFWVSVIALTVYLTVSGDWGSGSGLWMHGLEAFVVAGMQALANRWDATRPDPEA